MGRRLVALGAALVSVVGALAGAPAAAEQEGRSAAADVAIAHLGVHPESVRVTDEHTSAHNGVTHVYLRQLEDGVDIVGADATVNVQDGQVVHSGSRFLADDAEVSGAQVLDADAAVRAAAVAVEAPTAAAVQAPVLHYRKLDSGDARLVYDVELVVPHHWWVVSVDAETGAVVSTLDHVDQEHAGEIAARTTRPESVGAAAAMAAVTPPAQTDDGSSYLVYALPMESPYDGERLTVHNPADADASPFGWHDTDGRRGPEFTITRGNNVNAYHDTAADNAADPASQPDGGASLDFTHPILTFDATPATYRDAAVDNLFYMNNVMHDVTHRYGFDEAAGNFQQTNYSGRGLGNDAVLAEAQDGSFVLNANFATPPDGRPGRMQMFLWVDAFETLGLGDEDIVREYSTQVRDGDLDNGVIAHEYGHGVSNRLVGGPSNVECLRSHDERQGEGLSDFWSYVLTMRPGDDGTTPRGIGNYVVYQDGRQSPGIRTWPYSTDMRINPATYGDIRTEIEPHGVGSVWATMLWDVYWALVGEHGFNPNPYDSWETGGNNLAIQLVVDSMKFAPCEPGFVDLRDAMIAADAALTGEPARGERGENECLLWHAFARRGLGVDASQGDFERKDDGTEGFAVPERCARR